MAWRNITVEQERLTFIDAAMNPHQKLTFEALCQEYNISTKTGYKWLNRFREHGKEGLRDMSRARLTQNKRISDDVQESIIKIRLEFPRWGPKKIYSELTTHYSHLETPSEGSIGNILKKCNLSRSRIYRRHVAQTAPLNECEAPNDIWAYDFKGWFLTGDGQKCEPLTITDGYSRYLIRCEHMKKKNTNSVWRILEDAFLEYGLPLRMRSDNGPPFATTGLGRLSPLAIRLIKAGVTPEWIEPGCPQENGRHERFHSTLKSESASPPASSLPLQCVKFEQFVHYYNNRRPHEALHQVTPATVYKPSTRLWDGKFYSPEYSSEYDVRKVDKGGSISWKGEVFFLSESLWKEYVGIKEISSGKMGVYYGPILLGKIDLTKGFKRL